MMRIRLLRPVVTASWDWHTFEIVELELEQLAPDERAEIFRYLREGIAEELPPDPVAPLEPLEEPEELEPLEEEPAPAPPAKPAKRIKSPRLPKGPKR